MIFAKLPVTSYIVVADDLAEMRQMITETLNMEGYNRIIEGKNGEDAFTKMKAREPVGLAIVDLNMPKHDGIDFIKRVRSDIIIKKVPIIIVTAHAEQARVVEAIKAGATDFIAKPFNSDVLLKKLAKHFA